MRLRDPKSRTLFTATRSELHIGPGNYLKLVVAIDIRGKRGENLDWAESDFLIA